MRWCVPSSSPRYSYPIAEGMPTCTGWLLQQYIGQFLTPPQLPASPTPEPPTSYGDGPVDNHSHTLGNDGLNGSDSIPIDTSSGSGVFVGHYFSMTGMINDEEPGVWGLDAKLQM